MLAEDVGAGDALVVMGDFNVAPDERDVHDPDAWRGKVHFHPEEHEAPPPPGKGLGLTDLYRVLHEAGGTYSWWGLPSSWIPP